MNKMIKYILPILLTPTLLVGCNKEPEDNISQEEVNIVKRWVDALQDGIKKQDNRGFTTSLREKYNVQYTVDNDNETSEFSIDYEANGALTFTYLLNEGYEGNYSLGSIFQSSSGFFAGHQIEKNNYYSKTIKKGSESDPIIAELDYEIDHNYAFKYNDEIVYTAATNKFIDNKDHDADINGEFKAEINKEYVDETGSLYVEKLMSDILFLNAWTNINEFANLTNAFYEGLEFKNDDEVKEFMRSLDIKIKETEKEIELTFDADIDKIIYERFHKESHINAFIHSKNVFNKETNVVSYYSYDFKDVLTNALFEGAKTKKTFEANVDFFFIEGNMVKYGDVDKTIEGPFETYDDTTLKEFYEGFNEYVIPYHN